MANANFLSAAEQLRGIHDYPEPGIAPLGDQARHPLAQRSAGSVFKNPKDEYAGRLIEAAGLKGYRMGGVEISQQHANFFLNLGDGRAEDSRALMEVVRKKVYEKSGVELEPEIVLAGDWPETLRGSNG